MAKSMFLIPIMFFVTGVLSYFALNASEVSLIFKFGKDMAFLIIAGIPSMLISAGITTGIFNCIRVFTAKSANQLVK